MLVIRLLQQVLRFLPLHLRIIDLFFIQIIRNLIRVPQILNNLSILLILCLFSIVLHSEYIYYKGARVNVRFKD